MSSQIEIQSTSVDQAVAEALEHFGVSSPEELDIEILDEPKDGFFLGFGSKKAKIKAALKVLESDSNIKKAVETRKNKSTENQITENKSVDSKAGGQSSNSKSNTATAEKKSNIESEDIPKTLTEEEKEIVCDTIDLFLENISYSFDMDFHREIIIKDRNISVNINGDDVANLIGRRGQTLVAVQHLMNIIVSRTLEFKVRIDLDISGYKGRRKNSLQKMAREAAKKVESSGKEVTLEPMDAASRKTIHVFLRDYENISTLSVGEGDRRFVIVVPGGDASAKNNARKNVRPRRRRRRKPVSSNEQIIENNNNKNVPQKELQAVESVSNNDALVS